LAPFARSLKAEILDLKNDQDNLKLSRITPLFAMCPTLMIIKANHMPIKREDVGKIMELSGQLRGK
jgi:hypothetical protein